MDEASRMERAREMGFDTDATWYHGTTRPNEYEEFRASQDGTLGKGVYLGNSPEYVEKFAGHGWNYRPGGSIYPVNIRGDLWDVVERGFPRDLYSGTNDEIVDAVTNAGFVGVKAGDEITVFNPKNIRSINAKFDPSKKDSANLLDSRLLPIPLGLLGTPYLEDNESY